jgi:hypothetical protein
MQQARAATWQAYDKERFADFLARNIWVELSVPFHLQTRTQSLQNVGLQDNFPDQVQLCFVLARVKEPRQRLKEIALAKVIETGTSFCSLDQLRRRHSSRWNPALFQQCSKSIEETYRQLPTNLLDCGGEVVHSVQAIALAAIVIDRHGT